MFGVELAGLVDEVGDGSGGIGEGAVALGVPAVVQDPREGLGLGQAFGEAQEAGIIVAQCVRARPDPELHTIILTDWRVNNS